MVGIVVVILVMVIGSDFKALNTSVWTMITRYVIDIFGRCSDYRVIIVSDVIIVVI